MIKETDKIEDISYKVLVEPWITEAATAAAGKNEYVFKVAKRATKPQIRKAIKNLYKVTVLAVRTVNIHSKKRMRGKVEGKKPGFKKAMVRVKEGESIDIFGKK